MTLNRVLKVYRKFDRLWKRSEALPPELQLQFLEEVVNSMEEILGLLEKLHEWIENSPDFVIWDKKSLEKESDRIIKEEKAWLKDEKEKDK